MDLRLEKPATSQVRFYRLITMPNLFGGSFASGAVSADRSRSSRTPPRPPAPARSSPPASGGAVMNPADEDDRNGSPRMDVARRGTDWSEVFQSHLVRL